MKIRILKGDMKMDNNLKKLQDVEFDILLEIRRICKKHHLTYYLIDGTFLGAVRHKGFIPWDDDIDIAIPRSDYQKFVDVVVKELPESMEFKSYATDSEYHNVVARVVSSNICRINHAYSDGKIEPALVDIFPLDGMPDTNIRLLLHKINLLWRKVTIGWANYKNLQDSKSFRPWYERILIFIGNTVKPGYFMNLTKQYKKMEKSLMKYSDKNSKVYINFNGGYKFRSIMDKEYYFGKGSLYTFNNEKFNGPSNYDAYLTKIYGDYMKLPPESERNKHQTEVLQ